MFTATVLGRILDHPSAVGALTIAAKTALIYVFLIVGLRLLGKRELGQMSLYDLVMVIILGNAVQNAMVGNDTSLVGGIVAASVLLLMNRGLSGLVVRSRTVERVLVGQPVLIIRDGVLLHDAMAREGITTEQVLAALREHGIENLSGVHMGVVEVDGTISVVPSQATILRSRRHYRGLRLP